MSGLGLCLLFVILFHIIMWGLSRYEINSI